MRLLAIDFSAPQRSVAALGDTGISPAVTRTGNRVTNTVEMVDEALGIAGLQREEVECIAVGLGPGSYTGIRAAISFAQGWQLGSDIALRGVPTVEVLAEQARQRGWLGRVHIVIDAQRQELYLATYQITTNRIATETTLTIASLAEARARCAPGDLVCGPEVHRWFAEGRLLSPDASVLARMAEKAGGSTPGESLQPVYLRETTFVKAGPSP